MHTVRTAAALHIQSRSFIVIADASIPDPDMSFSDMESSVLRRQAELLVQAYKKSGIDEMTATYGRIISSYLPLFSVTASIKLRDGMWGVKLSEYRKGKKQPPHLFTSDQWLVLGEKREAWLANMTEPCLLDSNDPMLAQDLFKIGADSSISVTAAHAEEFAFMLHVFPEKGYQFSRRDSLIIKTVTRPLVDLFRNTRNQAYFFEEQSCLGLLKSCPSLKIFLENLLSIAQFDVLTLITGESGVGKDIAAKAIHEASSRKDKPFIKINCGAIPDTLLDSELFGYEKGAFTGAHTSKGGYFERADNGTLFLDEVGELSLAAQVRLLHVLEDGSIQRVGGNSSARSNVRIIAATNKDLWEECRKGRFREDLCYRLFVCHLHVPPLRERQEDIPLLLWYYLNTLTQKFNIPKKLYIPAREIVHLTNYAWPGNIRELRHTIERALLFCQNSATLELMKYTYYDVHPHQHNALEENTATQISFGSSSSAEEQLIPLDTLIARYLAKVMHHTQGRVKGAGGAAEILQIDPGTLRYKLKKYGLEDLMKQNRKGSVPGYRIH